MASEQSWGDSPSGDGPRSPFEVPPTPPPKDEHYVPRAPGRQYTFPARSGSISERSRTMRPPLSRYSTYADADQDRVQASRVTKTKTRPIPARIQTSNRIHVTTDMTSRSSPLSPRRFASMDQLTQTSTFIDAGSAQHRDALRTQTIRQSQHEAAFEVPTLQDPPSKAKPARKRNSLLARGSSLRRSLSQPFDLPSHIARPSVDSTKSLPPQLYELADSASSSEAATATTTRSKPSFDEPPHKPAEAETDSDDSSVRTSSSFERPAGKSTRSSSLTISDAKMAALKAGLSACSSEPSRSTTTMNASSSSVALATSSPAGKGSAMSRRSSCSTLPGASRWNPPRAVAMLPATAELSQRHGSEPAVAATKQMHRRSSSMQLLMLVGGIKKTESKDATATAAKLQKSKRLTKSTPMLRGEAAVSRPQLPPPPAQPRARATAPTAPPQLSHEWEISAPKPPRTPRMLPALPGFLRKSSRTVVASGGTAATSSTASVVSPFADTELPLPALKRVSLHAHNGSRAASALALQPPGSSYSVTCSSNGRGPERRAKSRTRGGKLTSTLPPPLAAPPVSPYTPGLRAWDEDEFTKWEEEDRRLAADAQLQRERDKDPRGLGGKLGGGLRRGRSVSRRTPLLEMLGFETDVTRAGRIWSRHD